MDDIEKKAEPIDAQDGEDFTEELASRDDYGEASHRGDPSEAYHDYLGDSANFSGFPLPVNQQELWNRFKDWSDNRKNKKLKQDKDKVGKERQPESIGEGYWSYKNTPYVAPTGQRAEFMAMPAQKEAALERIIMAEEMKDDNEQSNPAPAPLFEGVEPTTIEEAPKVEAPKGPALEKEKQEPIMPLEEFWSGLRTGLYVTVKAGPLDTPARVGDRTVISGDVAFDAEGIKASYPWEAFAIRVLDDQEPPSANACRLEINVKPVMKLVAAAVQKYKDHGMPLRGPGYYNKIKEAIPSIFEKIFQAVKQNSKQIEWKGSSSKHDKEAVTATITLRGMDEVDEATGFGLEALMDKSAIVSAGTEILKSGAKGKPSKFVPPTLRNMDIIRDFIKKIPENKFEWKTTGMYSTLSLDEIKKLAGEDADKLVAVMESMPDAGNGTKAFGDLDDFWCEYTPAKGFATFENKRLSNKVYLQKLQKVYKDFGGGSREQVAKNIAKALGVSEAATESWLAKLIKRLTPKTQSKVNDALGIKVVAYPTQPWAGPSLEQVGALVGPDKAMLASEWASSLADKTNYISYPPTFPTLVGGPGDIKKTAAVRFKLATLTLSDEQRALVEEYSAPATAIMHSLLQQYPVYDEEEEGEAGFIKPDEEEVNMLAEDVLINLVENSEGNEKPDKEDFLKELTKHLWMAMKRIQARPNNAWPSTNVDEEDALNLKERSVDPIAGQPEVLPSEIMHKRAHVCCEEDSIEVIPDHPHTDPSFYGKKGKVLIAQPDFNMSDENGPESIMCYLVSFEPGQERWFTDGEVRPTN
jgi:hypothetical protein